MLDIHVVSHTHWDREWYLTHEQFRLRLVALIDRLLDLLDEDPEYRYFHLDGQTIVVEDYLEIRPEQEPRLRAAIEAGRILIGPWYVMPDEFLVSGESIVRNLLRGHRVASEYGTPMPVGYLPDLFGHVGQMPQIWRQLGIDNTILWRGFGGPDAEYWWRAPDGSRVLMMHLPPEGYCNATRIVFDPERTLFRAAEKISYERARTRTGQALLMNGVDHVEPHHAIPQLIASLSAADQRAHHSTLPAYVSAVRSAVTASGTPLETIEGELRSGTEYANLLPGVLSARVYLKQQNAEIQTLLESYAEPLSVFASLIEPVAAAKNRAARFRYPAGELRHAWKTLLQNHPHDSICGCSIDAVHDENMIRFARARQVAAAVADAALDAIADSVPPPPADASCVRAIAVNTDASPRTQVVDAWIELPIDSAEPWRSVDAQALDRPVRFWPADSTIVAAHTADGAPIDFQILAESRLLHHEMSRFETPWALNARRLHVALWAPAIPPCGYTAFDLRIAPGTTPLPSPVRTTSIHNEHLSVSANGDGTFDVTERHTGTVYRRVAALDDVGDAGDEYNYCPPSRDRSVTNADARLKHIECVVQGPLRSVLRVDIDLPLPRGLSADRSARAGDMAIVPVRIDATLDRDSPRVAFTVAVENTASDHRLRMIFPTASRVERVLADTAFDVVSRPARLGAPAKIVNEAPVSSGPMISALDAGGADAGAIVVARGLAEYEVLDDLHSVAVTLLRAVGDLSRNDLATRPSGHAGPPMATPGAQCHGTHRFELAFQPRAAAPSATALESAARAHIVRPRVGAVRGEDGNGPTTRSFLEFRPVHGQFVLSALKQAENGSGVVARVFNPDDVESAVAITPRWPIRGAYAVNLLEKRQAPLPVADGGIRVSLGPHRIETIEIER